MTGPDYEVPPMGWDKIAVITSNLKRQLNLQHKPYFPIMEVLEFVLDRNEIVGLDVRDAHEMQGAEGYTSPDGELIILREDVYHSAWKGEPRARFTAAHELGHFLLHTGIPLARINSTNSVPPFRRSEPQANQFAAELLMPPQFFTAEDTPMEVMMRHGVSGDCAEIRLDYLTKKGKI